MDDQEVENADEKGKGRQDDGGIQEVKAQVGQESQGDELPGQDEQAGGDGHDNRENAAHHRIPANFKMAPTRMAMMSNQRSRSCTTRL